jgi:hypothetical protein
MSKAEEHAHDKLLMANLLEAAENYLLGFIDVATGRVSADHPAREADRWALIGAVEACYLRSMQKGFRS